MTGFRRACARPDLVQLVELDLFETDVHDGFVGEQVGNVLFCRLHGLVDVHDDLPRVGTARLPTRAVPSAFSFPGASALRPCAGGTPALPGIRYHGINRRPASGAGSAGTDFHALASMGIGRPSPGRRQRTNTRAIPGKNSTRASTKSCRHMNGPNER